MDIRSLDPGLVGVSTRWALITPNDSTDLADEARYLLILTTGDVKVNDLDGNAVVLPSVPAGMYFMGGVSRVWATGTHATPKIIAFYR